MYKTIQNALPDADGATKFQDLEKLETVLHFLATSNYKKY